MDNEIGHHLRQENVVEEDLSEDPVLDEGLVVGDIGADDDGSKIQYCNYIRHQLICSTVHQLCHVPNFFLALELLAARARSWLLSVAQCWRLLDCVKGLLAIGFIPIVFICSKKHIQLFKV